MSNNYDTLRIRRNSSQRNDKVMAMSPCEERLCTLMSTLGSILRAEPKYGLRTIPYQSSVR